MPMDYVLHVYVAAVLVIDLFACLRHRHGQAFIFFMFRNLTCIG